MLILVSDNVQMQFNSCFSDGDFVKISVGRRAAPVKESTMSVEEEEEKDDVDVDEQSPKLFTCPVDGCVKLFQRYSSLEYHLQCGTCDIVPERENLFDLARIIYRDKLLHDFTTSPVLVSSTTPASVEEIKPQGWALKTSKKATRFSERQKSYLDEKFSIGQETGHKVDAETVARNMRYEKDERGKRRFTVDEFLSPQQVQSYFSRAAAKLKNKQEEITEEDIAAAEEQAAYSLIRATVLDKCELVHPIVYQSFNLCNMDAPKDYKKLTIAMLRSMCEYFDLDVSDISATRKGPYIDLLTSLVQECSFASLCPQKC